MVCNVTGTLYQPDGSVVSDRQFMIRLVDSTISAGSIGGIVPDIVSGRTGESGEFSVDLFPGNYTIAVDPALNTNQRKQLIYIGPLSVPDAASIALSDALGIGDGYVPDVGAIIPPGDPGQVVGYDADGKPIPVDMAAASFPPGAGGQVVGYDADGTPVAVTLPKGMDASTYDPQGIEADAFDMVNMREGADANILTDAERGKLAGIEDGAEVNAVASVNGNTGAVVLSASDVAARPAGDVPWAEVSGKPATYPPVAHVHPWGDITGRPTSFPAAPHRHDASEIDNLPTGGGGGSTAWTDVTGKPDEFPPSAHSHGWGEITGKPATFAPSAHSHAWADVTGKPAVIAAGADAAAARTAIGLGTASTQATGDFATAAQGALADTAVQPAAMQSYTAPVVVLTQAQYDALSPPVAGTVYVVTA